MVLVFFTFLASLCFISLLGSALRPKGGKTPLRLPPGPIGLPVVGHLHMLGDLPHRSLRKLAKKYGPIMYIRLGLVPTIVVSSPEMAELFLKTHDLVCASRPKIQASKYLSYEGKSLIFAPYGPYWRDIRKICTLELLSSLKIEMFKSMRRQEVLQFVESLKATADSCSRVDVSGKVGSLVEDMTYRMIFGSKGDTSSLKSSLNEVVVLAGVFNVADYIPFLGALDLQGYDRRMKEVSKLIDGFLEKIIEAHMQDVNSIQGKQRDFIDVMVSLMQSNDTQEHLERDHIKAILLDVYAAGVDTSATVIVWTLTELLRNPRVMELVQEELEKTVGLNRMVEEYDLNKLDYLKMVVKESMRLHPVAPLLIPHESMEDITINGYFIPKKSRIFINSWAIGHDPKVWSKNVEEFYPERFIDSNLDVQGRDFRFIPFGSGRRKCPGLQLGITVVQLIVAQLVHCFNLELPNGMSPSDLDMSEEFGLTVPRANPLIVIPKYRLFI